jgi:hypothetical protein
MGAPQSLLDFLGSQGVPALVAGATYGAFEVAERLSSKRAREALSERIRAFDISAVSALPEGTVEIFNRFFGERHFSLKCVVRSACVSLGGIFFFWLLFVLLNPNGMNDTVVLLTAWDEHIWRVYNTYKTGIPFSLIPDYLNLYKTRKVLTLLTSRMGANAILLIVVLAIDFLVGVVVFTLYWAQIVDFTFNEVFLSRGGHKYNI